MLVRYIGTVPIALSGEPLWLPGQTRELPGRIARALCQRPDFVLVRKTRLKEEDADPSRADR